MYSDLRKKRMKALGLKEARPAYSHGRKYAIVDFCLEGKRLLMRLALFCTLLYPFLALLVPPSLLSAPLLSSVYIYLAPRRHKYLLPGDLALPRWLSPPVLNDRTTSPPVAFAFDVRALSVPQSARCPHSYLHPTCFPIPTYISPPPTPTASRH